MIVFRIEMAIMPRLILIFALLVAGPLAAKFELETVAGGLDHPWALAFLPDGRMLVTERAGQLRLIDAEGGVSEPIKGVPSAYVKSQGGLMDIALHPDFGDNGWVYLTLAHGTP